MSGDFISFGKQLPRCGVNVFAVQRLRADFREGDEDSNFSIFKLSGGSLNGPDLFTELPFLCKSLPGLPNPYGIVKTKSSEKSVKVT